MTLTAPSEIAQRHLSLFDNKHILLAGELEDDFAQQLLSHAARVSVFTTHHGYATRMANTDIHVHAGAEYTDDSAVDLVLFYWPKSKAEADFLLAMLTHRLGANVDWVVVGENRSGVKSIEKRFAPYGQVIKQDSARRCSLYHGQCTSPATSFSLADWFHDYPLEVGSLSLTVRALPGVFSHKSLDDGTALLLKHLPNMHGDVIDVGCGAGVIGSVILATNPSCTVTCVDVSYLAVASTQATLAANGLNGSVFASDMLSAVSGQQFDAIISNPPFHEGLETHYHATESLLKNAPRYLRRHGQLAIVANSFLRYPPIIEKGFGQCDTLAKTRRFTVYHAQKAR
ncbi:16S rRNA (guanine(1207)-N(2))-methyltransferase RsmC [Salinivibrio kushneri]|uniref:Ribosomal RNA small subunit methyltransferase C n=1 Tax=Salinivibrio kushneri TaxID=1908198 RepID=A0AA47KK68_9GAMM|nr:16S rRNA (guanine(1207)-N(2))-methyltransferase RsmC [Salinivibrio kushneri]WBA08318.1 16S rRNA (guanine(1207)-N(2))-methyltransferase RsmC [Salinivibrio kushneri]